MPFLLSRKSVVLLICLTYLIGAGSANAFILCYQPDGTSHAEFKPSGSCDSECNPTSLPLSGDAEGIAGPEEETCRDIPITLAQAKQFRSNDDIGGTALDSEIAISLPIASYPHFAEIQQRSLLSPNPPPPSPTLAALRTIVLLI